MLDCIFSKCEDHYILDRYPFIKPTPPESNIKARDYINRIDIILNKLKEIYPKNVIKGYPNYNKYFKRKYNYNKLCLYFSILSINNFIINYYYIKKYS